jgi:hypothetical protein
MLFAPITQREAVSAGIEREVVMALADLLLEAMQEETGTQGGGDEQHEDHG